MGSLPAGLTIPRIDIDTELALRRLRREDLDVFDTLHDDPTVWKAFGWTGPHNRGQNGQLLGALMRGEGSYNDGYKIAFAVEDKTNGRPRMLGIIILVVAGDLADLTVAIAPDARGRAIAPRVLPSIFDWCRRAAGIRTIVGVAKPDNAASIRMMEKAGMDDQGEQEAKNPSTGEAVRVREFHWLA